MSRINKPTLNMLVAKFSFAVLALLVAIEATPVPSNVITYEDSNGNIVTEDLDQPLPAPMAVDINKLKFMLYTVKNKDTPQQLKAGDVNTLKNSNFNAGRPTKFLIHGWQNNYQMESVQSIKDAYLANKDINVVICDYEPYNSPYLTAVSNNIKVGENIGTFISFLVSQGANRDLHIIGHSLGAHIAGAAARSIASKIRIARITGLDPAGPMFNNNKEGNRLSKTDADVVEAIHTSTQFGMTNAAGTHDFYCNGGSDQPSCSHASMSGGCDHAASFRYFAQSIAGTTTYPVLTCKSVADAQSVSKAPTSCANTPGSYMGDVAASTTKPGIFFVPV